MSDPTTWTLERALEMLRDWKDISILKFNAKWPGVEDIDDVAIAALESAAAEIERQKARADAAEKESLRLQGIIDDTESESGLAGLQFEEGCELPSLPDFVKHIVEERVAYGEEADALSKEVERLRAELAAKQPAEAEAAQQGPSDEDDERICKALDECVDDEGCSYHVYDTLALLWERLRKVQDAVQRGGG